MISKRTAGRFRAAVAVVAVALAYTALPVSIQLSGGGLHVGQAAALAKHGGDDKGDRGRGRGRDDGPNHDRGDDRGGKGRGSDDRPGDDHGRRGGGHGSDDRPGDDRGGKRR